MVVAPVFKRIRRCYPAAFRVGSLVTHSGRMRVNFIRRTIADIDAAAVGLPARLTRCKVLVGKCEPAIMFFLELVLRRAGGRIAARPELLDEMLPLLVCVQTLKRGLLFVSNDVEHVLVEPLLLAV